MYFRLTAQLNLNAGLIKKDGNLSQTLNEGRSVNADDLTLPWPFSLQHERSDPLSMSDYYPYPKLMSERLIETLRGAGVDSLQLFDADIVNRKSGERVSGYRVVNILGLVSAADASASKSRPLAHVRFFETLVLDEARARGQLMFRLAESLTDVIVAEKVAKHVADGRFVDVVLEELGTRKS
jgi:hypothetical protein